MPYPQDVPGRQGPSQDETKAQYDTVSQAADGAKSFADRNMPTASGLAWLQRRVRLERIATHPYL
jgi:hypothetical protein